MLFIEMSELKTKLAVANIELVRSPKTGKLFASCIGLDLNLKVEAALDVAKPVKFMYESEELLAEGCVVNVTPTAPPLHSW